MSIGLLKDRQIKLFRTLGHDRSAYRCAPWFDCSHLEWLIISLESQMRVDFCIEKCFKNGILVIHASPVVCPDPYLSRTQDININLENSPNPNLYTIHILVPCFKLHQMVCTSWDPAFVMPKQEVTKYHENGWCPHHLIILTSDLHWLSLLGTSHIFHE